MISHVFQTRNNQEDLFDLRSKIPLIREYIKYTAVLYGKVSVAKGVIVTPFLNQGSSSFAKTFNCSNSTIEALEKDVISLLFSVFPWQTLRMYLFAGQKWLFTISLKSTSKQLLWDST